ncbi:hypothetical protein FRC11_013970, partial [Ceratobasidium sp. 423]
SENDAEEKPGIERYRAGRVHAFFHLPEHIRFFHPGPLAYLELFTPFNTSVSPFNKLESTKPDFDSNGLHRTLVVPVSDIIFACHLVPKFHLLSNELELHCHADLLSESRNFWLNHYYNHHFFRLLQHWRRRRANLQRRLMQNVQASQVSGPAPHFHDALDAYSRAICINPYISQVGFNLGSLYESRNNQILDVIDAYA